QNHTEPPSAPGWSGESRLSDKELKAMEGSGLKRGDKMERDFCLTSAGKMTSASISEQSTALTLRDRV
ncbi:hypothetical protein GBF38_011010, partial [Nibea albiflora]